MNLPYFAVNKLVAYSIFEVICSRRNYCKIKITEDSIEQKQLVNGSI